jgi:uncharacterized membrane protein YoaK (UPF0700 family)
MVAASYWRTRPLETSIPMLLSVNGGYVDTMSFLALRGLFAAHVTGNFVTFGAAIVLGTSGAIAKLAALPVFCIVVILSRLGADAMRGANIPVLRTLLLLKFALLLAAAALAISLGPFRDANSLFALLTGMTLVSAMAIQNAAHRVHLPKAPPSTLMTGNTTQIMLDVADMIRGIPSESRAATIERIKKMSVSVASFAGGCGAAALLFTLVGERCFLIPAIIAFTAFRLAPAKDELEARDRARAAG